MNAMQCEKAVHLPHPSVQLSANAESSVRVCAEELSSSSTLNWGEGEGGERVAYLVLGFQGPTTMTCLCDRITAAALGFSITLRIRFNLDVFRNILTELPIISIHYLFKLQTLLVWSMCISKLLILSAIQLMELLCTLIWCTSLSLIHICI